MKRFLAYTGLTALLSTLLLIPKDSSTGDFRKVQNSPIGPYASGLLNAETVGEQIGYSKGIDSILVKENNQIMKDSTVTPEEASMFIKDYRDELEQRLRTGKDGNPQFFYSTAHAYLFSGIHSLLLENNKGFNELYISRDCFKSAFERYYASIVSGGVQNDSDKVKLHDATISAGSGYYQTSYYLAVNFLKQAESFASDDSLDTVAVKEYYGLAKKELDDLYLTMKGIYNMKLTGINPQWRNSLSFDDNKLQELYQRLDDIGQEIGVYGEK
ncbi:MAG: hypothetical protein V1663_02870 [archaeon]